MRTSLPRKSFVAISSSLITIFLVAVSTFLVLGLSPGDSLSSDAWEGMSEEQKRTFRAEWHLDEPLPTRFALWLGDFVRGDFGRSIRTRRPVFDELSQRIIPTLELNVFAISLMLPIALSIGWFSASRRGTRFDRVSFFVLLALYAAPGFWIAMLLQDLFAVRLDWFPLYGRQSATSSLPTWLDRLQHLILPGGAMALGGLAFFARFARSTAIEGLTSVHALFARGAGVHGSRLFHQHAVRPSLVPLATMIGLMIPGLVSGSVLIETLFSWPGLGLLFFEAIVSKDTPVIMALTVISAVLTVAGSLMADLLSALFDPRTVTQ